MKHPRWIWSDVEGRGRNLFVWFRYRFQLDRIPRSLKICLFADSLYRVTFNGKSMMEGPARFLPSHPEYDQVDLLRHAVHGQNEILVLVNARGAACFQAVPSIGGFIAWGGDEAGIVDFSTPGDWMMYVSKAWDREAEPFSFAQGPIEIVDLRTISEEIEKSSVASWRRPVILNNQHHWGVLSSRSIPYPSRRNLFPSTISVVAPFLGGVHRCGFRLHHHDGHAVKNPTHQPFFTHLHSPREQLVEIGVFWGEYYLNGSPLEVSIDPSLGNRRTLKLKLQKGWNFFFGFVFYLILERFPVLFEFPDDADLSLKALPDNECHDEFYLGKKIEVLTLTDELRGTIPSCLEDIKNFNSEWRVATSGAESPAREMAWDRLGAATVVDGSVHFPIEFSLDSKGGGAIVLDFGQEYLGHICVEIESEREAILDLAYDERLREDRALGLYIYNPFVNTGDRYRIGPGTTRFEGFHERGGRYLQLNLRSFGGKATLKRVWIRLKTVDLPEDGSFSCSDELLNWTWQTGVNTLQQSLCDGWVDPWRERGLYLGDALVEGHATRKFSSDWRTDAWAIRLWSRGQLESGQMADVIPSWKDAPLCDYTLLWILMVSRYWKASGDLGLLREVYFNIPKIFSSKNWKEGVEGLWETHGQLFSGKSDECSVFIDWSVLPEGRLGVNSVLNAYRIYALELSVEMALAVGRTQDAQQYEGEAKLLRDAFSTHLWDPSKLRYAPCLLEGKISAADALHANILALAWGIGTEEQLNHVERYVVEKMEFNHESPQGHVELFFLYFALEALYSRGQAGLAERVICHHYGRMKVMGAWGLWECLDRGIKGLGSHCHGWSTAPLVYFSERILGVRPDDELFIDRVLIAPESESLNWAKGRVPHPRGIISVYWRIVDDKLYCDLSLPPKLKVKFSPRGRLAELVPHLFINGEKVTALDPSCVSLG